jgi:hypothetical protein
VGNKDVSAYVQGLTHSGWHNIGELSTIVIVYDGIMHRGHRQKELIWINNSAFVRINFLLAQNHTRIDWKGNKVTFELTVLACIYSLESIASEDIDFPVVVGTFSVN